MKKGRGLKLGIIGVGSMGKNHARIAASLSGVRLAGIADVNAAAAEEVAKQFEVQAFQGYKSLLPEVEAVCIVTPTGTHLEIARDCLEAGKHVLVEKPFTGEHQKASSLINLAKQSKSVLHVNLIERYNPAVQKLLRLIKGEKIHGADFKRFSPFPERISDTDVIFDMMFHDIDLLSLIVPDEIESIKAKGEKLRTKKFDRATATILHKSGTISRIDANRVFGSKTRKTSITTEKHLIEADLLNKIIYVRDFSCATPSAVPVKPADQLTLCLEDFIEKIKAVKKTGELPSYANPESALLAIQLAERIREAC